ncbi:GNAT family N-acetyltransferase [Anaerobacillus alkaliphilus]|uniref:GNAT family N-acetyltransferase n=1 Tax=Anaerobacillus alkaliphilus TaxID=1548597 RepID=A0A4Q0VX99_9BACI|nr:GNAT family N-acetyltransferase [Anaerobacillus alkaliphilus]RXJ04294.1 GNAT family N-acetyltransferase [Anaerobacillus alkaliphilus]
MIMLKEVTKENWFDVILLRSGEDQENRIFERDIASNCLSLAQASIEKQWITRAVYVDEKLVGFAMYGFSDELKEYEVCRFMIDYNFQGNGYGKEGLKLVMEDMINRFQCERIVLTFHPENEKAKNLYEKIGFTDTGSTVSHFVDELVYSFETKKWTGLTEG